MGKIILEEPPLRAASIEPGPSKIYLNIDRAFLIEGAGEDRNETVVKEWLKEVIKEAIEEMETYVEVK